MFEWRLCEWEDWLHGSCCRPSAFCSDDALSVRCTVLSSDLWQPLTGAYFLYTTWRLIREIAGQTCLGQCTIICDISRARPTVSKHTRCALSWTLGVPLSTISPLHALYIDLVSCCVYVSGRTCRRWRGSTCKGQLVEQNTVLLWCIAARWFLTRHHCYSSP